MPRSEVVLPNLGHIELTQSMTESFKHPGMSRGKWLTVGPCQSSQELKGSYPYLSCAREKLRSKVKVEVGGASEQILTESSLNQMGDLP